MLDVRESKRKTDRVSKTKRGESDRNIKSEKAISNITNLLSKKNADKKKVLFSSSLLKSGNPKDYTSGDIQYLR